jgi:hypothetical protein
MGLRREACDYSFRGIKSPFPSFPSVKDSPHSRIFAKFRGQKIPAADGSVIRPYLLRFASFAVVPPPDSALLKMSACFYSGAS